MYPDAVQQFTERGFVVIPGPCSGKQIAELATAYDNVMALASGPNFKDGSTTLRMSDLLNHGPAFDNILLYSPLLEVCRSVIGEPFKLSSFLARTLKPNSSAQRLHADLPRDSEDAPLIGFILMIDTFTEQNSATRFVPTSQNRPDLPPDPTTITAQFYPGEVLACGEAGSLIVFNGAVWHGHTANKTAFPRRSIQGYFVRRSASSGTDFREQLSPATQARFAPTHRRILMLE